MAGSFFCLRPVFVSGSINRAQACPARSGEKTLRLSALYLLLTAGAASAPALASSTNFGDFVGDTVVYEDVLEVNGDLLLNSGFTISGDTLDFTNAISSSFEAVSALGGSNSVSSQVNAFIQAIPDNAIESFEVEVTGDSQLLAFGSVTQATSTRALLSVTPRIIDVAGSPVPGGPLILAPTQITLAEFNIVADGQSSNLTFSQNTVIPVAAAALAEFGIAAPITRVLWSITLTLEAESEEFSQSQIGLNNLDNFTVTAIIPEPSSLALLGITACIAVRRRRR